MRLGLVLGEAFNGLRRNASMVVSVVLVTFISLTFVGVAILLADEPTGNLDPATSQGIMALLERINLGGTTVVMATHEAGIVDRMQRRVVELLTGHIVRDERGGSYVTQAIPTIEARVFGGDDQDDEDLA